MSWFTDLFRRRRPPTPPSPYPLTGRDDEFRGTIRAIYLEELGREPDPAGMASRLHELQWGLTGERLRADIHDSAEAVAYRERPKPLSVNRPLVGGLRILNFPDSHTHTIGDQGGPRRILFTSWFVALRDWKDRQDWAKEQLANIVKAGYQGIRIFRVLGESDTEGYFAGRSVLPEWSIPVFVEFATECKRLGLRLQVTCGRQWSDVTRLMWEQQWLEAVRDAGLSGVIALYEGDNEYWQNAPGRDSDQQIFFYGRLFSMVRATLSPAPFCACGAPQDEAPELLYRAATHSDVLEIHGKRDKEFCIKRAHGRWYWDGDLGHFPKPMWEGEPAGTNSPLPGGQDMFMPIEEAGRLTALYAIVQLTGGPLTHFTGACVRSNVPLDSAPSFYEMPKLLANLPEDVATWGHVPGGRIWWWAGPDNQFAVVADEIWGPGALETPPGKTIAEYKVIGPNWATTDGSGPLVVPAGSGGALFMGRFA